MTTYEIMYVTGFIISVNIFVKLIYNKNNITEDKFQLTKKLINDIRTPKIHMKYVKN